MRKRKAFLAIVTSALVLGSAAALAACSKGTADIGEPPAPTLGPYTITVDAQGGTYTGATTLTTGTDGKLAVLPGNATKTGYTFDGWYTDNVSYAAKITTDTRFYANSTIYAKWGGGTPVSTAYTVTFHLNGGNIAGSTADITKETNAQGMITGAPADPAKDGESFKGWAKSASGTPEYLNQLAFASATFNANTDLYAIFGTSGGGGGGGGVTPDNPNGDLTYGDATEKPDEHEGNYFGAYIVGKISSEGKTEFDWGSGYKMTFNTGDYHNSITVYLKQGDVVKVRCNYGSNSDGVGYEKIESPCSEISDDTSDDHHNIVIGADGYYTFEQWWMNNPGGGGMTVTYSATK